MSKNYSFKHTSNCVNNLLFFLLDNYKSSELLSSFRTFVFKKNVFMFHRITIKNPFTRSVLHSIEKITLVLKVLHTIYDCMKTYNTSNFITFNIIYKRSNIIVILSYSTILKFKKKKIKKMVIFDVS